MSDSNHGWLKDLVDAMVPVREPKAVQYDLFDFAVLSPEPEPTWRELASPSRN